jgi:serine/threonine protein kinase
VVDDDRRLRSEQSVELVAARCGLSIDVVADVLLEGALCQRYLIFATLAKTRRATVFAALDLLLAREVAIKVHENDELEVVYRALAEARAMSRVDHPNVVKVFDFGEHEGRVHAVMELCEADMEVWRVGRAWREIIDRILDAGAGLEALHAAELVHADVKPANILIKRGIAKIADLGFSGPPDRVYRISGTVGFIAPEVADGRRCEAGDVFGLACTAWYCLLGVPPFGAPPKHADASSAALVLVERARAGEIVMPLDLPPGLPRALLEVLRAGLSPVTEHRPTLGRWLSELRRVTDARRRWWRP